MTIYDSCRAGLKKSHQQLILHVKSSSLIKSLRIIINE